MKLLEVKNPKAPLARKTITHRFIGGCRWRMETSPVRDGREWVPNFLSSLTELIPFGNIFPSVETPGYGLPSCGLFLFAELTPFRIALNFPA
jgi:hypothetical protein